MGRGLHILGGATVRRDATDGTLTFEADASWKSVGAGIIGGAVALSFADKRPVLLALDGYELASTAMDLRTGAIDRTEAGRRIGRAALATAAVLFLPIPSVIAWIAGAVAANWMFPEDEDPRAYADAAVRRMMELGARAKDETVALVKQESEAVQ